MVAFFPYKCVKNAFAFLQLGVFPSAPEATHSWGSYHRHIWLRHGSHWTMRAQTFESFVESFDYNLITSQWSSVILFPSSEPTMGCAHSHTNAQGAEGCKNLKVGGESALNLLSRDHFFLLQPFKYPTLTWWQLHACITARQVLTSVHSGTTPARRKRNSRATFQFSCVHK